jgi:SAM-dependent methyltransferase
MRLSRVGRLHTSAKRKRGKLRRAGASLALRSSGLMLLAALAAPLAADEPKDQPAAPKLETEAPKVELDAPQPDEANDERVPDIVYVPTPHDIVAKMLKIAKVKRGDVLYDLGCGDGRIMIAAARKTGCKATGFEIDSAQAEAARKNVRKQKVEALVTVEQKDIFEVDLSPASVVTLYLLPELNVRLIPQLETLKPGSRIVSHDFNMEGVEPDDTITVTSKEDNVEHFIYLWTTPLKKTASE